MKVFLSWSGDRSRNIAESLRETLPLLMNAVKPWMSELDIDKGERWNAVIAEALDSSKVGIFCLTTANVSRPAILFEAGAISKSVTDARVCVLLEGMQPSDLSWPWSQFQTTRLHEQKDMFKMLSDMNKWLMEAGEPALPPEQFTKQLGMWWPEFQRELTTKPSETATPGPQRSEKDMLVEVLDLLRSQKREAISFESLERIRAELEMERMRAQRDALESQARLEAVVRRVAAKPGHTLLDVMVTALSRKGHETACAELLKSRLSVDDDGARIVSTPSSAQETSTALVFNEEAQKVMLDAARSAGYGVLEVVIRPIPPPAQRLPREPK